MTDQTTDSLSHLSYHIIKSNNVTLDIQHLSIERRILDPGVGEDEPADLGPAGGVEVGYLDVSHTGLVHILSLLFTISISDILEQFTLRKCVLRLI